MQRNSVKSAGHVTTTSVFPVKPPKPPCWLDLKAQKSHSDDGIVQHSPTGNQNSLCRSGKTTKRSRPKLHRTRSQFCIHSEDMPDFELTTSLAETKPEDLGLSKEMHDDTVVMQETARKCQNWLQSIQGCGPPEMTSYLSSPEEEAVDVEVPDQTSWYDEPDQCPLYDNSEPDSDANFNVSLSNMSNTGIGSNLKSPKTSSRTKNPGRKYELRSCNNTDVFDSKS